MAYSNQNSRGPAGAGWLYKVMTILRGLILVLLTVTVFWLVFSVPIWRPGVPKVSLTLSVAIDPAIELLSITPRNSPLNSLETKTINTRVKVGTNNPWIQWFYYFFFAQIIVIAYFYLDYLRKIVGSVTAGEAFSSQNAQRLRRMGILTIGLAIYSPAINTAYSYWILDKLNVDGGTLMMNWTNELSLSSIITGWVLIILSEVFRQGATMREEQTLTI